MNEVKKKNGSIIIGFLFFVTIIIFLFIFAYETALMFIMKQKSDNIARDISSSIILNVDTEKMIKEGKINLNKNKAEIIAEKILDNSYKGLNMFTKPSIDIIYNNSSDKEIDIFVLTKIQSKEGFAFYKDVEIVSTSQHKAHTELPLSSLKHFKCPFIDFTWGNFVRFIQKIWSFLFGWLEPVPDTEDMIIFEEVF